MTDARFTAYEGLLAAQEGRGASSVTKDVLDKYSYLDNKDRRFIKRLIEGTIERRVTLDHVLDLYSSIPARKMKKQVRTLLRMGAYQILYMDGVSDHAAVNETVKLAKKTPVRNLSGFINGVLRKVSSEKDKIPWPDRERDIIKYMSVMYSCPEWIVDMLIRQQTAERAEALLKLSVSTRKISARVNLSVSTVDEALQKCNADRSGILDEAIILKDYDNITDIPAFADGTISIQDISSMLVCHVAGIKKDDTVLDLCAAPGGKSLHAADIATKGKVIARDVTEKKLAAIRDNVNRCGFTNIEVVCGDATVYCEDLEECADIVIADVPCSGLGVMGRKNDIKYNLTPEAIDELAALSRKILANAARYVKRGGILMFSTCTVTLAENQQNACFLAEECHLMPVDFYDDLPEKLRDDTAKEGYLQLYGKDLATDGFFIGKFRK